jgi:beta-glucosidase
MEIDKLLKDLTIEEKCSLLVGKDAWRTKNIDRLEIPSIFMADGPHGLRKVIDSSSVNEQAAIAVCYPSLVTLASSFDPKLASLMGEGIASEFKAQGVNLILGPGINIKRHPFCGRNFEYFSEDPLLTIKMATGFIKGAKETGIGVCLKHYALNSQEDYRMTSNSIADERAKHEIYYRSFQELVKLDPEMVMCSYNKIDDMYASENIHHLKEVLREEFGFNGVIVSDWAAVNNRSDALIASLDLEMPGHIYTIHKLIRDFKKGLIPIDTLDSSVKRVLTLVDQFKNQELKNVDLNKNHLKAARISEDSMVLLKNEDNMLPLKKTDKVLLVGDMADKVRFQGGGSSNINPYKVDSVKDILSKHQNVFYCQGYDSSSDDISSELLDEVKNLAPNYDKILMICGLPDKYESEGYDRTHLSLPKNQEYLINQMNKLNQNIIVVLQMGSPIVMPFIYNVKAILNCYLGGEALGTALDRVLFGVVNPSGRLAETFPLNHSHIPSNPYFMTGNNNTFYQESIYLGYRYYNSVNQDVLFPFGYGLSYSHFEYSNIKISKSKLTTEKQNTTVSIDITNNGPVTGKEVVLLFFEAKKPSMPRPKRELLDFDKVTLKNGETKTVKFVVNIDSFKYYHPELKSFITDDGIYNLQLCKNARDILIEEPIEVSRGFEHPESIWNNLDSYDPLKGLEFKDDQFEKLIGRKVTGQSLKYARPFTINNNLEDISHLKFGKFVHDKIRNSVLSRIEEQDEQQIKIMMSGIKQMPLRALAIMSDGELRINLVKALIAITNKQYFKAIKFFFRKD